MNKDTCLLLPDLPKNEYYEDYVASVLSLCGQFIERRVTLNSPLNILELDVVSTCFSSDNTINKLTEIKSGKWGLSDIFKVRGWLDYLKYSEASFVVLEFSNPGFEKQQEVASSLSIDLLNTPPKSDGKPDCAELIKHNSVITIEEHIFNKALSILRYSYCLERVMIEKYLKPLAKEEHGLEGYKELNRYIHIIQNYSFFENDAHKRLHVVFEAFTNYNHITARIDNEKETKQYNKDFEGNLTKESFKKLFYEIPPEKDPLYVAFYGELYNRLIILKLVVEETINDQSLSGLIKTIKQLSLPENIRRGAIEIKNFKHYYLWPILWQNFIFVMGGFILTDKLSDEYHILSVLSGVPEEEIEPALNAFDMLFPIEGGRWLLDKPNTSIKILQFMPLPFSGIGTNFRRLYYLPDGHNSDLNSLKEHLNVGYTVTDMIKFNNLAVEFLSLSKELIKKNGN